MSDEPRGSRIWLIPWIGGFILVAGFIALMFNRMVQIHRHAGDPPQIDALRVLASSQRSYYQDHFNAQGDHEFAATLDDLAHANPPLIPPDLAAGRAGDYVIKLARPARDEWRATAAPAVGVTSDDRQFYVDDTGVIRFERGAPAGPTSTAVAD
jgi:hypothetical protein